MGTSADPLHIADRLAKYQAGFNLLGRLTVLKAARAKVKKPPKPLLLMTGSHLFSDAGAEDDTSSDQHIYTSFNLPPTGALDYLRNLTPVTREIFDGLTKQYRSDAITVAGVNDQRIISKIRDALGLVVTEGGTPEDFRKIVNSITDEAGEARLASFEIDTVFHTNTLKAYAAGRHEQMTDDAVMEALPFWQYWTVGDDRVRPEHHVLDQFTARAVDPVWIKIYPPCGFNCRCSAVPIAEDEAPEGSSEGGLERLPLLARLKVPQSGFRTLLTA